MAEAPTAPRRDYRGKVVLMDGLANAVKTGRSRRKSVGAVAVLFLHDPNIHNGPAPTFGATSHRAVWIPLPRFRWSPITKPDGTEIRPPLKRGHVKVRVESIVVK